MKWVSGYAYAENVDKNIRNIQNGPIPYRASLWWKLHVEDSGVSPKANGLVTHERTDLVTKFGPWGDGHSSLTKRFKNNHRGSKLEDWYRLTSTIKP